VTTVVLGLDPHPASHTVAALDANGKVLRTLRVDNTEEGFEQLRAWAGRFEERSWAVEGASNPFIASWVGRLSGEGERLFNVPPSLTSQYRSRRGKKKNDEIDAQNAARALLANPDLPPHRPRPGASQRELQVLSRTRRRLGEELKANRMALSALAEGSAVGPCLRRVEACLAEELKAIEALMGEIVRRIAPEILEVQGVGEVLASTLLAEVGDVGRFATRSKFVSYCGAGPSEKSSGKTRRARVNTGGNRRMNHALHMIARVRLRLDPRSRALFARKRAEGKTPKEAWRVLKTYIARELYHTLKAVQKGRDPAPIPA
jgi:transposase